MSSGCGDVLSLADLQTAKKHQIFEAEVITGKSGGVAGGADIDYATNQVTGQTQKTLPAVLRDAGFSPVSWDFSTGGTLTANDRDKVVYDPVSKTWYSYAGTLPVVVPASFNPVGNANWKPQTDPDLRNDLSSTDNATLGDAMVGVRQPFTDAVGRTQHDKNREVVSVLDFYLGTDPDYTNALNRALTASNGVLVPQGEYSTSLLSHPTCSLFGTGGGVLKQSNDSGNHLIFDKPAGGLLSTLSIVGNKATDSTQGQQVSFAGGRDVTIKGIDFKNAKGTGFSLIAYPRDGGPSGYIVSGIRGDYSGYATNKTAGCVLFESASNTIINDVIARNYPQFGAVELKTDAKCNVVSGVIGQSCQHVVYNGTATTNAPSSNIISNVVADNAKYAAVVTGNGSGNLVTNVVADYSSSEATQAHGVTLQGNYNAADNILMVGCSGTNSLGRTQTATSVRFLDGASNNYASVFPMYSASGVVTLQTGATRNFVEVKHPGPKNSLLSSLSTITGASSIDGTTTSNVVHAPAIGQYIGSMSGRFEWFTKYINTSALPFVTADKFRLISDGATSLAIGGGTTSQIKLLTSDGTSRTISLVGGNLRLASDASAYIQIAPTAITPSRANTVAIGSASHTLSGGFTQTAFTVTSDERAKTLPLELTDAMLDAWAEVNLVQYKYLNRVAEKGEDAARWHFGVVAQRAIEAFTRHGLDATKYGFLCYDKWEASPEIIDEESGEVLTKATAAGERYGIRYDEVLILEAALQRRKAAQLEKRIIALETLVATLTNS
ncbi:TPA: tail fiber domain-containing protein [Escherichia coli]